MNEIHSKEKRNEKKESKKKKQKNKLDNPIKIGRRLS